MEIDYTGRKVLVTGGAGGIGSAIVREYGRLGATVGIADVDRERGIALEAACIEAGYRVLYYHIDLGNPEAIRQMFDEAEAIGGHADILVNVAGVSRFKPMMEMTPEEWDEVQAINLRAPFLCSQCFVAHRKNMGYGRIVNVASTRAIMCDEGNEAYAASKGGLVSLTRAMALSLAHRRITVNCISPGWIETGDYSKLRPEDHAQHPSGRVGHPEDVALACLYLTAPSNDFINGENIVLDGGFCRKMQYLE